MYTQEVYVSKIKYWNIRANANSYYAYITSLVPFVNS